MHPTRIDDIVNDPRWAPRRGWHDDHRHNDRTPAYLPAIMQVRAEFMTFVEHLEARGLVGGQARCLQLGLGECDASHEVWMHLCPGGVVTLDWRAVRRDLLSMPGQDIRAPASNAYARAFGPYDVLFIDAGHKALDVAMDHAEYGDMVRSGGVIAFHDSCKRPGYEEEIEVWRYVDAIPHIEHIGTEVGIAWFAKG